MPEMTLLFILIFHFLIQLMPFELGEDFDNLLSTLEAIKGKFLLSSYRNEKLQECVKRNGWHCQELKMYCSMTSNAKKTHSKVEVLTANFPFAISVKQDKKDVKSE